MGFLRTPTYKTDPALEEELRLKREEEERLKQEQEEAKEKRQKRFAAGKLGARSLFSRAGGRGFYQEGEESD